MAALGAAFSTPAGAKPCNPTPAFRLPPHQHLRYAIRCSKIPGAPAYPPPGSEWSNSNNNNNNFSAGAPPPAPNFNPPPPPPYSSPGPPFNTMSSNIPAGSNANSGWRKGMHAPAPAPAPAPGMNPQMNHPPPGMNPPMNYAMNPAMNHPPPAMNPPPGWRPATGYAPPQHAHAGAHGYGSPGASSPPPAAPGYNPAPALSSTTQLGNPGGGRAPGYQGNTSPRAPRVSPPPRGQTSPRGGSGVAPRGPMPEFKLPDGTTKWTSVDEMRRHYFPNAENEPPPKRIYKAPDPKAGGFVLPDGSRKWNSIDEMRKFYFPNEDFSAPPKRTYKPPDPKAGGFVLPDGSRKWKSIDEMRRFYFPNEDFSKPPKPFGSSKDSSAAKQAENKSAVDELKKKYFDK